MQKSPVNNERFMYILLDIIFIVYAVSLLVALFIPFLKKKSQRAYTHQRYTDDAEIVKRRVNPCPEIIIAYIAHDAEIGN